MLRQPRKNIADRQSFWDWGRKFHKRRMKLECSRGDSWEDMAIPLNSWWLSELSTHFWALPTLWECNTCNWTKMPVYSMEYEHSVPPPPATHTHTLAASSSTTSTRGSSITKKHCHCSCHPTRHHREGWGIPSWWRTWPENAELCV